MAVEMSQQPKSWQKKYLAEHPDHTGLYFYPEAQLAPSQRVSRFDDGYTPVGYPGHWIPCVPVGANPDASRRIADMLCALFRLCVPHVMEVTPVLTDEKALKDTGAEWYEWTATVNIDACCALCGAIESIPHTLVEEAGEWLCAECIDSQRWHELYWE